MYKKEEYRCCFVCADRNQNISTSCYPHADDEAKNPVLGDFETTAGTDEVNESTILLHISSREKVSISSTTMPARKLYWAEKDEFYGKVKEKEEKPLPDLA